MNKEKKPVVNRLPLIQNFSYLSSDIRMAVEGKEGNFYAKVLQLNDLAEKYLGFVYNRYNLTDEEFLAILRMTKACLFLNLKIFKFTEKSKVMTTFRGNNPDFERLNSPNTDSEPWKGIKEALYGHQYGDDREQYRELVRPLAGDYLEMFNDGDLDHLEIFLPVDVPEMVNYVRDNFDRIEEWSKMVLKKFQKHIETLSSEDLRLLEMELASIKQERDFPEKIRWQIQSQKKKLQAVRRLRFNF